MGSPSIEKALSILDLFQGGHRELTGEEIAELLNLPISTCYRYLKNLGHMGYLASMPGKGYSLGPKIILLGHHLQMNDPLIAACRRYLDRIVKEFDGTATINRVFRQTFISIYSVHSKNEKRTGFGAGKAMSIYSGANALVIQAFLSRHLQEKLYIENKTALKNDGRGDTFKEFRKGLLEIRRSRLCSVEGAIRPDSTGIAAPLIGPNKQILGTCSFSILTQNLSQEVKEKLNLRMHEIGILGSEILGGNSD